MQASGVIHYIVNLICQAFPAYKPEELYEMNYSLLMTRLAQAESKLLRTGMINEPIKFQHLNEEQPVQKKKQKVDTKTLLEKYYDKQDPEITPQKKTPVKDKKVVITSTDMDEHVASYTGHEKTDRMIIEHKMVKETAGIYKDYIDQMKKGEKVTIPSHEERMAAARERMAKNKEKAMKLAQIKKQQEEEMYKNIAKENAKKRVAAKKKR